MSSSLKVGLTKFRDHYASEFGPVDIDIQQNVNEIKTRYSIRSDLLRDQNYPTIFHHGRTTSNVVVLIHGLTDSPFYMEAIAKRFYDLGANVVLPLLPGHGLKQPKAAIQDDHLADKWKQETDHAVEVAHHLGQKVSIGGLSTGGALSLNIALRSPEQINGGLFLFSAAVYIGAKNEQMAKILSYTISHIQELNHQFEQFVEQASTLLHIKPKRNTSVNRLANRLLSHVISNAKRINGGIGYAETGIQNLIKRMDGKEYTGMGPDPYKYPKFSWYGALQLTQIIRENNEMLEEQILSHPVFAAHSVHDESAIMNGILKLFEQHGGNRVAFIISETPSVLHPSVVLEETIHFDKGFEDLGLKEPQANPNFDAMMEMAAIFYKKLIVR